jgi:hypothetical protein
MRKSHTHSELHHIPPRQSPLGPPCPQQKQTICLLFKMPEGWEKKPPTSGGGIALYYLVLLVKDCSKDSNLSTIVDKMPEGVIREISKPLLKPCQMGEAFDTCQTSSHFDMPSNWGVEGATNVAKKGPKGGKNATNVAPPRCGKCRKKDCSGKKIPPWGKIYQSCLKWPHRLAALARTESLRVCIEQGIIALHLEFQ